MARLIRLSVILLCLIGVICAEPNVGTFKDEVQFVLDSFNDQPGSQYVYDSAKIINAYNKNDSLPSLFFMQLDITVSCNNSVDCTPSHLICELVLREDSSKNTRDIYEDRTKCAKKEFEPIFPVNDHGFGEENVSDEIRSIAAFAVQHVENNGDAKRSVVDIMSVKRQSAGNFTTLYLTLKVARTDGGDTLLFEVCEAEVNQTAEMALESTLACFPLTGMLPDVPMSAADITTMAERAAEELDSLSFSEFTLKLVDVLRAETTVTPGSEAVLTTLDLRIAPTLCLKNVDVEGDTDGLYEKRQCPENVSNKRFICSITSWDRPWIEDTLYSEPTCYQDAHNGTDEARHTNEDMRELQEDVLNTMLNDQIEPLSEQTSLPAVEHYSITAVDEQDPVVETVEESRKPIVEEPIIATHTYCTGCLTDLDVSNPALQEYVDQAVAVIDEGSYGRYMHKVTRIAKAQKQVVNGVKYILQLEVAETSCMKGSTLDRTSCEPSTSDIKTCLVEFLEKPWLDTSREIIGNNCTYYDNDLENEIEPNFVPSYQGGRQEMFDYLDAMDEPEPVTARIPFSYGRDGLYLPEHEPDNRPVESDAEQIYVNNPDGKQKKSDKSKLDEPRSESISEEENSSKSKIGSDDFKEAEQTESQKVQGDSDESDQSSDESNEKQEKIMEDFGAYFTGENRNRRETTPRSTLGGLKDIDKSELELVNKLAHIAVQTLDEIDEDDKKRVVLEVLSAQKQIVNGVLYHLHLRVGTTSCSESGANKPDCMEHHSSPVKICKVELHRTFTDNSHLDAKVVKSECTTEESILPEKKLRQKRDVVPGGPLPANTSDTYITDLADFAVTELDKSTNSLYSQCLVRIVNASKQVVAGYNVFLVLEVGQSTKRKGEAENSTCELNQNLGIKTCHVTIWDQPWLENSYQVTSLVCSAPESKANSELPTDRVRRQTDMILGAPSQADVNDSYIQEIARHALAEVDRRSNAIYRQKIVRIVNSQKQVVAGTLVRLTLELGYTSCRKGEDGDISNCQLKEDSSNQICNVDVWDRSWLNLREVTNVSCSSASENTAAASESPSGRARRHADVLVGAPAQADLDDPYIHDMAKTALEEVDRRSNALYRQKIVRIVEAQKQMVAGVLTHLTLELGYSACRKGHDADIDGCQLKNDSNNQICHIEVWDRPWLNQREVNHVSCSSAADNRVKRRSWIGGGSHDIHIGLFDEFVNKHNKHYQSEAEYKRRFHIFKANMKKVERLRRTEQGTAAYGATQFADLTPKEFKKYHLGLNRKLKVSNDIPLQEAKIPDVTLPKEFDWRNFSVVTEVKNQGSCGSCWAFSVTGNIEGQWALKKGKLFSLSEQELVDCDNLDDGCNGGLPENAYKAIESLGGLETEKDYPYEGEDEKCHFKKSDVKVTVQGALNITKNETKMAQWLYKNGPISIGINANAMQFYMGGVSHPWKFLCDRENLDHGVLIVGFGVHTYPMFQKVLPFWIIKNSWGANWGEQGYYRVYRGDGTCGVNQMATSAIVV
ncbi:uncharacterized protein LOC110831681 isoform X2 [Zootermopsis nevadensis]|uniref:uncharacterized protein LOC110831681 isoform X1 n=1 Tax=Zootermopsis nevadensis TaxID=136037 RepID=UPI000B8EC2C1|nr:uncharacterized protein LOC110831681 isoform X1 [Zootermopsis nevadensis]XP_021923639.1 uncharacterized protein LOC110831681 isoform X2 [Zootermopsis nevadensis]